MATVATLEQVTRRYGAQLAVDALDLEIPRGGVYALLGPNGAGKTTSIPYHAAVLAAFTGTFLALAALGWRRLEETRS